jgi:hypothetical protein
MSWFTCLNGRQFIDFATSSIGVLPSEKAATANAFPLNGTGTIKCAHTIVLLLEKKACFAKLHYPKTSFCSKGAHSSVRLSFVTTRLKVWRNMA